MVGKKETQKFGRLFSWVLLAIIFSGLFSVILPSGAIVVGSAQVSSNRQSYTYELPGYNLTYEIVTIAST